MSIPDKILLFGWLKAIFCCQKIPGRSESDFRILLDGLVKPCGCGGLPSGQWTESVPGATPNPQAAPAWRAKAQQAAGRRSICFPSVTFRKAVTWQGFLKSSERFIHRLCGSFIKISRQNTTIPHRTITQIQRLDSTGKVLKPTSAILRPFGPDFLVYGFMSDVSHSIIPYQVATT